MEKKRSRGLDGIVFSTDPGFKPEEDSQPVEETQAARLQPLRIRLDTRQRAGKAVTLVEGFLGKEADLEELGKKLKAVCGTGGTVKGGAILIQGDHQEKIFQWLIKNEYKSTKRP